MSDVEWLSVRQAAVLLGVSPRRVRRAIAVGLVPEAEVVRSEGRSRVRIPREGVARLRLEPSPVERRLRELTAEVAALREQLRGAAGAARASGGSSLVPARRGDDSRARTLLSEIDVWLRTQRG